MMARNINSILQDLSSGLADLKNALQPITAMLGAFGASAASAPSGGGGRRRGRKPGRKSAAKKAAPAKKTRRAKRAASPKLKALRALQGRYMGAVRHLSAGQKAQVKKVRAESGYDAALKLAGSLGKQG
jgi:hypothetical protein